MTTTMREKIMRSRTGMSLIELLVCMVMLAGLMFAISMIYFSCLKVNQRAAWKLPPYDEATLSVEDMTRRLREAMLVYDYGNNWLIVEMPLKDSNHDNVLILDENDQLSLTVGDKYCFYLSNANGTLTFDSDGNVTANGNDLWLAIKHHDAGSFTPYKLLAEDIHPELNPIDPATGLPQVMFRYFADDLRVKGVEMCVTSIAVVHNESRSQTATAEVYLRNL
jgi:hypothetical protein